MLKYIKHHLTSISSVEVYPIISFVIFFLFFLLVGVWVFRMSKKELDRLSNLPLDNN